MMYECDDCKRTFFTKSNYNRHVSKAHPEESEEDDKDYSDSKSMSSEDDVDSDNSEASQDDEGTLGIWEIMSRECEETGLSIHEIFKYKILFLRAIKKDKTHKSVMETLQRVRDEEDMDFEEALDFAVEKRRFLINRQIPLSNDEMKE